MALVAASYGHGEAWPTIETAVGPIAGSEAKGDFAGILRLISEVEKGQS